MAKVASSRVRTGRARSPTQSEMSANPASWAPPNASPAARAMWMKSPLARFYDVISMDDAKADEYTRLLFESFSLDELRAAVARMIDIRPLVKEKTMIEEWVIGNLAKAVIRAHWAKIDYRLSRPGYILNLMSRSDPTKHAVLATPEGRKWLNWTCYEVDGLLAYYARPKNYTPMAPPPGPNPLRPIPEEALTGAHPLRFTAFGERQG
jgi:hypothetical protein